MKTIFQILISLLCICGCAYYSVSKDDFLRQLSGKEMTKQSFVFLPTGPMRYEANNLEKLLCQNKNGDTVWLYINQNTNLEIKMKNGKVKKAYFDTIILENDKITGLRSRIIGIETVIPIDEIEEIKIYIENGKVEKYKG
jgi:hypothetical protein